MGQVSGIYCLYSPSADESPMYIGLSISINDRYKEHIKAIQNGYTKWQAS